MTYTHTQQEKGPAGDEFTWDSAKRVLGDPYFIKRLIEFDRDNIPDRVVRALQRVMADPAFTPEQVCCNKSPVWERGG